MTGKKLPPDPQARDWLFRETAEARKLAKSRLAADASDRDAMFAVCMAMGVETDYTILVEKRYFHRFSLSRQPQAYARKLPAVNPPVHDAHLTLGMVDVVGSMNFFFRLFVHFDQIEGSSQQDASHLKEVAAHGRYCPPLARILLSVIYLREHHPQAALPLLRELVRDYPENPLLRREAARAARRPEGRWQGKALTPLSNRLP